MESQPISSVVRRIENGGAATTPVLVARSAFRTLFVARSGRVDN